MRIIMHKANDGTLFESAAKCATYNAELQMQEPLERLLGKNINASDLAAGDYDIESLARIISKNADEFRNLLNAAPKRRGRPSKSDAIVAAVGVTDALRKADEAIEMADKAIKAIHVTRVDQEELRDLEGLEG